MSTNDDIAEYYHRKSDEAHRVGQALLIVRQLQTDGYLNYAKVIQLLEQRLEAARYTGD